MKAVDKLLDIYNDYLALYKTFGDEYYKQISEEAIRRLKLLCETNKNK